MTLLEKIALSMMVTLNLVAGVFNAHKLFLLVKEEYYYCHSTSLGDLTLLVRASSVHEANEHLIEYLRWTGMLGTGLLVCSEVYNPEK